LLLIATFWFIAKVSPLGSEFMPQMTSRKIQIDVEMPNYYDIERTKGIFEEIRKRALSIKEADNALIEIGNLGRNSGGYLGRILVNLHKDKYLERSTEQVVSELQTYLLDFPDATIKVKAASDFEGPGSSSPIEFQISGDDQAKLSELTYQVLEIVKQVPGTTNVDSDIRPGKPEIKIVPDKRKLVEYGTDVASIAQVVRTSVEGITNTKLKEKGIEYDIRIQMDDSTIDDLDKISKLSVMTPKGNVKISDLAKLEFSRSPSKITRKDKSRQYQVTADITNRTTGEINADVWDKIHSTVTIPEGCSIDTGFMTKIQKEMGAEFAKSALIAIILTFLLIAGILESYRQSFLIMITVPLALLGVIWSLKITGIAMNLFAMMAGVMLIGIVVNNAILILDYANVLKNEGHSVADSIVNASATKLKAIIMATMASVFGMLPLALGVGEAAAMQQGMGIVSLFGLIFSAVFTQFTIPAFYASFMKDKHFKRITIETHKEQ